MAMLGNIDTQGIAMNQVVYLVALAPVALLLALLYWRCAHDPKEPPLIPPGIPIIGHALGIIQHGVAYYTRHSARYPSQLVYTMDLLLNKAYIINSPSLVAAVQRNHRVISFDPFLTGAANRMAGITGPGLELLREEQNGGQGINNKVLHSMHPALLGTGLDRMNEKMIKFLKLSVDELATTHDPGTALDLHAWCRHAITVASTDAVYGLLNPYKKREIEDSLWAFESRLTPLLINIMPSITSRTSYKARERLVSAFVRYYEAGGHEDSSELTYNRWKVQNDAGATTRDIARLEAAAGIGILSNTVPSTFWTIFDIYSRPSLLSELREEVCKNGMIIEPNTGLHVIDLASIRDSCHLLVSSFQETLRLRSNGAPTRVVCKDILLNGQWLLKEGSILQMPAPTINRQPVAWGEATDDFNPRRFMKDVAHKDLKRATAFMSFGASPNICPGRHFASGEILALAAMMILRYDITPVSGVWRPPVLNTKAMAASVTPPGEEFPVKISEREEFRGVKWDFRVTEGRGKFSLVVG